MHTRKITATHVTVVYVFFGAMLAAGNPTRRAERIAVSSQLIQGALRGREQPTGTEANSGPGRASRRFMSVRPMCRRTCGYAPRYRTKIAEYKAGLFRLSAMSHSAPIMGLRDTPHRKNNAGILK